MSASSATFACRARSAADILDWALDCTSCTATCMHHGLLRYCLATLQSILQKTSSQCIRQSVAVPRMWWTASVAPLPQPDRFPASLWSLEPLASCWTAWPPQLGHQRVLDLWPPSLPLGRWHEPEPILLSLQTPVKHTHQAH